MRTRAIDGPRVRFERGFGLVILLVACGLVAAIAVAVVPAVIASRQAAHAAAALAFVKTWQSGQLEFKRTHGVFASNDDVLVRQGFIRWELGPDGTTDGHYRYVIDTADANGWSGRAEPVDSLDGVDYFYADETGLVTRSRGCSADRYDPPAE
jgi:hypothetical protein